MQEVDVIHSTTNTRLTTMINQFAQDQGSERNFSK